MTFPERLAQIAATRCLHAKITASATVPYEACIPCIAGAIRQALDEAAKVARNWAAAMDEQARRSTDERQKYDLAYGAECVRDSAGAIEDLK